MLVNNPEAYALFKAQIACRRGEIASVYKHARYFLNSHSGFYAILGAGMLLASCAIWSGDEEIWYEAKHHICEAPCKTQAERDMVSLALAITDSSVYNNKDFPEWFKKGDFELLPPDAHPAAKVFYIKYLYMDAFAVASKEIEMEGFSGLSLMSIMPFTVEPLITQAIVDKTVVPQIFLRMSCAVAYHNSGNDEDAIIHIDRALKLALPDKLYGILVEYIRHFDGLLEERIALFAPDALDEIKELYKTYSAGWSKLSGAVRNRNIASNLTSREREVAKLAAFGFTTKDIASMLYISESTVKQTVLRVVQKTGVKDRSEFASIL
jgi:DNA-binding CsgD family transcriptional regulator